MAESQDLHQIEYRHHPTRDFFPVASSMLSAESLQGWHSRLQAWVRHPHNERLAESVCYQDFPNGQAAIAWRYWDERAAARADGSRGRPLVSRVLVGPDSVLSAPVAVALCRDGLPASLLGPSPGEVPDGGGLPTVSGDDVRSMIRERAAELDQEAARQPGLQALVAAALADPPTPLAITLRDNLIQKRLRDGVQGPLLWGLIRIAGPLLGRVGRGWSFSTYELPLGEMDPASLPAIVFRQAQEGHQAPPKRHRRELKVRPYDTTALLPGSPYAGRVELAGWLVDEYAERGGAGLRQLVEGYAGGESPFQMRVDRVEGELAKTHTPVIVSPGPTGFVQLSPARRSAPMAGQEGQHPLEPAPASAQSPVPEPPVPEAAVLEPAVPEAAGPAVNAPVPVPAPPVPAPSASGATWSQVPQDVAPGGDAPAGGVTLDDAPPGQEPPSWQQSQYAVSLAAPTVRMPVMPPDPPGPPRSPDPEQRRTGIQPPAWTTERSRSLAPTREGRPPDLPVQDRSGHQSPPYAAQSYSAPTPPEGLPQVSPQAQPPASAPGYPSAGNWGRPSQGNVSVRNLLTQLGMAGQDRAQAESILRAIGQRANLTDPEDRQDSWKIIANIDWCVIVCNNAFHPDELAGIFRVVVIPDLAEHGAAEPVGRWALNAPPPMIGALLAAANEAGDETWQSVVGLLEPFLALRLVSEAFIKDHWDTDRAWRLAAEFGRGESKGGRRNPFRRR